jgi:peptide deformylase
MAIRPAIRPIVRLGHPALRTPAEPVDPDRLASPEFQGLIDDMVETMRHAGGVGLAATQVGIGLQIFVYEVTGDRPVEVPLTVVINPLITPQAGDLIYEWEGCLSIPELRGLTPRHPAVHLQGLDRDGNPLDRRVEGFEARVIQHEFDHLNGIVYLDRMRDLKSLAYAAEQERYLSSAEDEAESTTLG